MPCSGCSNAVNRVLSKTQGNQRLNLKGINNISISLENQTVVVESERSADEILEVLKKTGKQTEFVSSA